MRPPTLADAGLAEPCVSHPLGLRSASRGSFSLHRAPGIITGGRRGPPVQAPGVRLRLQSRGAAQPGCVMGFDHVHLLKPMASRCAGFEDRPRQVFHSLGRHLSPRRGALASPSQAHLTELRGVAGVQGGPQEGAGSS